MAENSKYEKIYRSGRGVLGAPFPEILEAFGGLAPGARVLDLGAGQGRDALPIARMGHHVLAVDFAPTGLDQLKEDAVAEGLRIDTYRCDLNNFAPTSLFDVLLADRTFHLLKPGPRHACLTRCLQFAAPGALALIADERANLAGLAAVFAADETEWAETFSHKGFLFLKRSG